MNVALPKNWRKFRRKVHRNEALAHTATTRAMRLPVYLIAFFLAVLLASTTPIGTGAGAHQFDLLHPLFTHVHLVNGKVLTHEEVEQSTAAEPSRTTPGPSLGAGAAGGAVDAGAGISPVVPGQVFGHIIEMPVWFVSDLMVAPDGTEEAPPVPPPL